MASTSRRPEPSKRLPRTKKNFAADKETLPEAVFHRMIALERKRSERTQRPFVLLLMDAGKALVAEKSGRMLLEILSALQGATRETDIMGWYQTNSVVGVIFTEIGLENNPILAAILSRISEVLSERLSNDQFSQLRFSFHVFPEHWDSDSSAHKGDSALYPDLHQRGTSNQLGRVIKRMMDMSGSLLLLILLSPIFFLIAALVKLTSCGPVLFKQNRIGEHGIPFTFLKFRSMYVNNDSSQHREYVQQLIAGRAQKHRSNGSDEEVFKLTNDPRITGIGSFLRRTSLDELPQLFNVLRGEMSLVGPRPPLPYEVEAYAPWHRRRLLEAKPGITGLWQVYGRSRVGFDDMVRLDLHYARHCSPWLDVKILLQTPKAVINGNGAC